MKLKHFNPISSGGSGMFAGQVVLRQRHGKTLICKAPPPRPGKGTPKQEAARAKFTGASNWAMVAIARKDLSDIYQQKLKRGQNVQNLAVSDYFHAPVIHQLDAGGYTGQPGHAIYVEATDNILVKSVTVYLYAQDGSLLECGNAISSGERHWIYTTTGLHHIPAGCRMVAVAKDMPGNEAVRENIFFVL